MSSAPQRIERVQAEDRTQLAELAVRYGHRFDAGDGEGWAALFAPDGVFVRPDGSEVVGTDALAALPPASMVAVPGMRHFPGPMVLEIVDGVVHGRSYSQAVRMDAAGALALVVAGEYEDTFVRLDTWKFQTRRFIAWTAAAS